MHKTIILEIKNMSKIDQKIKKNVINLLIYFIYLLFFSRFFTKKKIRQKQNA